MELSKLVSFISNNTRTDIQCVFAAVVCSSGVCLKVRSILSQLTVMPQNDAGVRGTKGVLWRVVEKFREKRVRNINGQKRCKLG